MSDLGNNILDSARGADDDRNRPRGRQVVFPVPYSGSLRRVNGRLRISQEALDRHARYSARSTEIVLLSL